MLLELSRRYFTLPVKSALLRVRVGARVGIKIKKKTKILCKYDVLVK